MINKEKIMKKLLAIAMLLIAFGISGNLQANILSPREDGKTEYNKNGYNVKECHNHCKKYKKYDPLGIFEAYKPCIRGCNDAELGRKKDAAYSAGLKKRKEICGIDSDTVCNIAPCNDFCAKKYKDDKVMEDSCQDGCG
jgi:hypothetical protein